MQRNEPIKKTRLGLYFKQLKDINATLNRLVRILNVETIPALTANPEAYYQQFIIATNGRTFLLNDIFNLEPGRCENLRFLTKDSKTLSVLDIKEGLSQQTVASLRLTNHRRLADLLILLANPSAILNVELPSCGVKHFPVIFPVTTIYGQVYESWAINKALSNTQEDPNTHQPLTFQDIVEDKSLGELVGLIFTTRQKHIPKLKQKTGTAEEKAGLKKSQAETHLQTIKNLHTSPLQQHSFLATEKTPLKTSQQAAEHSYKVV